MMRQLQKPDILLHDSSLRSLNGACKKTDHSFLITGQDGSGKLKVAKFLANKIVGDGWQKQAFIIEPDEKGTISIDKIKEIKKYLNYKTSFASDRRIIIINQSDKLTIQAQNSLLKMLEEPSKDTLFILISNEPDILLDTILSRLIEIKLKPLNFDQILDKYPDLNQDLLKKLYLMSGGAARLLDELINDKEHYYREYIDLGKKLLGSSVYERLININDYSSDKEKLEKVISATLQILISTMRATSKSNKSIKPFIDRMDALLDAQVSIKKNHNTKLTLTLLFCRL